MAINPEAYAAAIAAANQALSSCNALCETDYCRSVCIDNYKEAVEEANTNFNTEPASTVYDQPKPDDLLIIGRGDTSYKLPFGDSGIALAEDIDSNFIPNTGEQTLTNFRMVINDPPSGRAAIATSKYMFAGEAYRLKEGAYIGMDQWPRIYIKKWVEIPGVGTPTQTQGFTIKGETSNDDNNLLIVEHPTDSNDRIKYFGEIDHNKCVATKEYVDLKVSASGGGTIPTGLIMFWGHAAPVPQGWKVLDGGDFDVNIHTDLHNILSQTTGYQPGKLPDYRDRFVCGIGTKHSGAPGTKLGELTKRPTTNFTTNSQSLTHSHGFTMDHSHTLTVTGTTNTAGGHSHTYSAWTSSAKGGGTGSTNPDSRSTSLTTETAGSHSHTVSVTGTVGTYTSTTKTTADTSLTHSHSVTGGGDAVNRPLTIIGYWIIKT